MEGGQFLILILACGALFWCQKSDTEANRTEASAARQDMLILMREIQQETKEFHARLCVIEERRK